MGQLVITGSQLMCSFGLAPSFLMVLPTNMVNGMNMPAATIMDYKPMVNILPFGMCQSLANPTVAVATSAAFGALTPQPCIPNLVAPWTPGSPTVMIKNLPALNNSSICNCLWAGVISVTSPGQGTINVA
ncbi:MAG: DUF4280 domain-containing protein [Candidatus Promineifilaceae bacterium]